MALKLELPRARIKTNPDLPRNVVREVRNFFHANGHNPSDEAYAALSAIPQTVVDILDGTARQAMHICPLDVGLGKTTTLRYTVRAVREENPDTGMLLCLGRLEQPDAEKRYDNVTFKIKNGPSGKRAFWANCQERLEEAAEIIRLHPGKKVLIIHPKEVQKWQIGKIGNTLEGLLGEELVRNIYYLHWGVHDAVNDYADCSVAIVLSLFIYPRSAYEIIGRAAANRRIRREYGDDEANAIEHGEVLANIRQALGRSCIRRMEGSQAHECTIYMRVPAKSQLRKEFGKLFPGCNVVNLEGKLDAEERVLAFMHAQRRQKEVTWPTVYQATGMAQSHFSALMKRSGLLAALQADGWGFVRSRPNKFIR